MMGLRIESSVVREVMILSTNQQTAVVIAPPLSAPGPSTGVTRKQDAMEGSTGAGHDVCQRKRRQNRSHV